MTMRPGYGVPAWRPAGGEGYLRASTADRERVIDLLKAGFAEGRLTKDEYEVRVEQALAARTLGDLTMITADLPGAHPAVPMWPPRPPGTNHLAIGSLVCGVSQVFVGPLAGVPAIILGHMARREIRRTGEQGRGLATAGLALGWVGVTLLVLVGLMVVAVIATLR